MQLSLETCPQGLQHHSSLTFCSLWQMHWNRHAQHFGSNCVYSFRIQWAHESPPQRPLEHSFEHQLECFIELLSRWTKQLHIHWNIHWLGYPHFNKCRLCARPSRQMQIKVIDPDRAGRLQASRLTGSSRQVLGSCCGPSSRHP